MIHRNGRDRGASEGKVEWRISLEEAGNGLPALLTIPYILVLKMYPRFIANVQKRGRHRPTQRLLQEVFDGRAQVYLRREKGICMDST